MIGVGTFKISTKARQYVNDVLTSERLSYGPFTQKFERVFAAAHDCRFAVMTNSGSCSLLIALAALKNRYHWADGDEVIVPAVTFIATSNIVLQLNMKPVFVDVDPLYYELDPHKIEAAITPKTRCIIPVHLFGQPCDMALIVSIAKKHNLRIIEDSCETMFAKENGKSVGSFGDIGCFSTYMAHLLTTGVGGLCTTNDPELAIQLRSLMNHGRDSIYLNIDDDKNKSDEELQMIIPRRFSFVQMGYSFRVTELEGAIGLAEFENRDYIINKRRENAQYFNQKLAQHSQHIQLPETRSNADHSFMMYPIVLRNENKNNLVTYLETNGVETREMLPLINQPFYKELFQLDEDRFPVAKWINNNGFYIGCHQGLTEAEKEYIVQLFNSYFLKKSIRKEKSCLILLSNGEGRSAELLADTLPLTSFDEYILVDAAEDKALCSFYTKRNFKIISKTATKGHLLKEAVDQTDCENIVILGADGADDPADINSILVKLKQGNELVIASRFIPGGGRFSSRVFSYRSFGNRFFTFLINIIFGNNITDCNNLFRGFKKQAFKQLPLTEEGESVVFQMTLLALQNQIKFTEVATIERDFETKRIKRNRFLSALSFFWILTKHLLIIQSQGKKSPYAKT